MSGTISGSLITTQGKQIIINRSYTATPDYTSPTQFGVGVDADTPNIADTDLDNTIPISDGTILDGGDITFTPSFSGSASTSNTTTYKEGAGTSDVTAQNMVSESPSTSGTKTWYLSGLDSSGTVTQRVGFWLYISGTTAYNKFGTSGTAVEMRLGSGTATNYYYKGWTSSDLTTGWNWMTSGTAVSALSSIGASGTLSEFTLEIYTNNSTDTFSSGDIIYDLLRQWEDSDLVKDWVSGTYPDINESTLTVEMRGELATTEANGFDLDSFGDFNTDTPKKMSGEDVFPSESKSSTDKFTFIINDRLN